MTNRIKRNISCLLTIHYFHFVFFFHEKSNYFLAFLKRVHEHSVILEYFSCVFRIFTRVFLPRTKFSTLFRNASKPLREWNGACNLRGTMRSRSLVLICSLCRQARLFSPAERDKKKEWSGDLSTYLACFISCRLYVATPRVLLSFWTYCWISPPGTCRSPSFYVSTRLSGCIPVKDLEKTHS